MSAGVLRDGLGSNSIIGSRSFALVGLVGVCWGAAALREHGLRAGAIGLICFICTVASLSRLAIVVSLFVVALSAIDFDRFTSVARSVALFISIAAVAYLGSTHANPVTNRFVTGDVVRVHGVGINANGREAIWRTTWESARRTPLSGHGAGSADGLVARRFQPAAVHVHNDYLRLFHDYGVIGVGLWILSFAQMFRKSGLRKSERRASLTRDGSIVSVAAQLGLLGLSLAMLTDNPLLYSFVVTPVGLLVGAAMGLRQLPARLPTATAVRGAP